MPDKRLNISHGGLMLWVLFYCYATVTALIFQKLVLPMFPALHAGEGLLLADATYFHQVAVKIADSIRTSGWSLGVLWPDAPGAGGNVTLLGILYALFGKDPSLILPVNAVFHATSGIFIVKIAREIWPGRVGSFTGVATAVLFVCFPSSLNWYAQVHKDGYVITGIFVTVYAWVWFFQHYQQKFSQLKMAAYTVIGALLILFVRPYNLIFISMVIGIFTVLMIFRGIFRRSIVKERRMILGLCLSLIIFAGFALSFGYPSIFGAKPAYNSYKSWGLDNNKPCEEWQWKRTPIVPEWADNAMKIAARTRAGLVCYGYEAFSTIDREEIPNDFFKAVRYFPRALQVALFAPFPNGWLKDLSLTRLVGLLEISCWYLLVPGIFLGAVRTGMELKTGFLVVFSLGFLLIYGFTIANIGTLHRIRYPYLFLLMLPGVSGWFHFLRSSRVYDRVASVIKKFRQMRKMVFFESGEELPGNDGTSRRRAVSGSLLVASLVLLSFLGFFARDILMARTFGLGDQLDAFFIAMLIPNFIVSVFCQSYGSTSVPLYLKSCASNSNGRAFTQYLSFRVSLILVMACLALALCAPVLLKELALNFSPEKLAFTRTLFYFALPLLLSPCVRIDVASTEK